MNCDEARRLLDAYSDGELDILLNLEIEKHLTDCEKCALGLKNLTAVKNVTASAYFSAPADLRQKVLSRLTAKNAPKLTVARARANPWLISGLTAAAALVIAFSVAQTFWRSSSDRALLAEITDSHVRSLAGTHLTDVVSSDQHTVRPWFEGKIDFAPPVEDLTKEGFPLVGGRLEYISGRAVAALVYERRKHFINLFVWPGEKPQPIRMENAQRGYNVLHWEKGGMNYWAVSEISENELRKFAETLANRLSATH